MDPLEMWMVRFDLLWHYLKQGVLLSYRFTNF